MRQLVIALLATPAISVMAQQPTRQRPAPISHYMREVGILYLETLQEALDQARANYRADEAASLEDKDFDKMGIDLDEGANPYGRALEGLEERIRINTELPGDEKFLKYLEHLKNIGDIARLERQGDTSEAIGYLSAMDNLYVDCEVHAHTIIDDGIYTDGKCTDAAFASASAADSTTRAQSHGAAERSVLSEAVQSDSPMPAGNSGSPISREGVVTDVRSTCTPAQGSITEVFVDHMLAGGPGTGFEVSVKYVGQQPLPLQTGSFDFVADNKAFSLLAAKSANPENQTSLAYPITPTDLRAIALAKHLSATVTTRDVSCSWKFDKTSQERLRDFTKQEDP